MAFLDNMKESDVVQKAQAAKEKLMSLKQQAAESMIKHKSATRAIEMLQDNVPWLTGIGGGLMGMVGGPVGSAGGAVGGYGAGRIVQQSLNPEAKPFDLYGHLDEKPLPEPYPTITNALSLGTGFGTLATIMDQAGFLPSQPQTQQQNIPQAGLSNEEEQILTAARQMESNGQGSVEAALNALELPPEQVNRILKVHFKELNNPALESVLDIQSLMRMRQGQHPTGTTPEAYNPIIQPTSRPWHQTAIEAALKNKDFTEIGRIIDRIPPTDPYKQSMEEMFRPMIQQYLQGGQVGL